MQCGELADDRCGDRCGDRCADRCVRAVQTVQAAENGIRTAPAALDSSARRANRACIGVLNVSCASDGARMLSPNDFRAPALPNIFSALSLFTKKKVVYLRNAVEARKEHTVRPVRGERR